MSYITNHEQDPSYWMTPMKSSSEAWKRTGNTSPNEWKGTQQSYPQKGQKKYSIHSARVIKTAGNDYRVVHISLIMVVGVSEVAWVMATYFIRAVCNCPVTTGKQKECTQMLRAVGDENQSWLWNMTTKFEGREKKNSVRVVNTRRPRLKQNCLLSTEHTADKLHCNSFCWS